ncbi:hypothetical protein BGW80DRAFT_1562239 [Lactifluus volemus]|nr:hypothetical protein BGW80DRAFT_1562239 [Lactifluus volemus]
MGTESISSLGKIRGIDDLTASTTPLVDLSNGLPTPSTSRTSNPCFPQQQPGAAATATTLTAPVPGPAPAATSAASTATSALRGWDTQSMHADVMGPFLPPFGTSPGPGSSPGATVEYLQASP